MRSPSWEMPTDIAGSADFTESELGVQQNQNPSMEVGTLVRVVDLFLWVCRRRKHTSKLNPAANSARQEPTKPIIKPVRNGVNATLLNSSQFFPKSLEIPSWVRFVVCTRHWACASPHFPNHSLCKMCECPSNKYAEQCRAILLFCHSEWHNFLGLAFLIWNSTVAVSMLSCWASGCTVFLLLKELTSRCIWKKWLGEHGGTSIWNPLLDEMTVLLVVLMAIVDDGNQKQTKLSKQSWQFISERLLRSITWVWSFDPSNKDLVFDEVRCMLALPKANLGDHFVESCDGH